MIRNFAATVLCVCFLLVPHSVSAVVVRQLPALAEPALGVYEARGHFGSAVASDGRAILIGSLDGYAHLYDPTTGSELAVLSPPVRLDTSESISIDGTKAVVGSRGRAFVYNFADLRNIKRIELIPDGQARPQSMFGFRVDISGDTIIVGDNAENHAGEFSGAAYLFDASSGQQFAKLTTDDAAPRDNLGIDVAISGTRALVGASGAAGGAGAAYLFDASRNPNSDRLISRHTADPPNFSYSGFGYSLDITGNQIVVAEANGSAFQWTIGERPTRIPTSEAFRGRGDYSAITERFTLVGNLTNHLEGGFATLFDNTTKQTIALVRTTFPLSAAIGREVAIADNLIVMGALPTVYIFELVPEPSTMLLSGICALSALFHRRRWFDAERGRDRVTQHRDAPLSIDAVSCVSEEV